MDHYSLVLEGRGLAEEELVGREQVIIPNHLVKYTLREGGGPPVQPGMTIECIAYVYLADGTPIVRGHKTTRFLFGRGRLITGLELGLRGVRLNEKLRLVVSPEYGYEREKEVRLVPPGSKLVFELEVVEMGRVPPDRMTDPELYYEVFHCLDRSEERLRARDEPGGLEAIREAYFYAKKIRQYRCLLPGKILLKWANILYHREEFEEALAVGREIEKVNAEVLEDSLRLEIRVLRALGRREEVEALVEGTYSENMEKDQVKRVCVDYYKET